MHKIRCKKRPECLILLGIIFIIAAFCIFIYLLAASYNADCKSDDITAKIHAVMPGVTQGAWQERSDMRMPSAEICGTDFIGLIEVPMYDAEIPVESVYRSDSAFPCRYMGSVYDGSLVIGDANRNGLISFMKKISPGAEILFTDMDGYQYCCFLCDIEYTESADIEALAPEQTGITIFFKDSAISDGYTIIRLIFNKTDLNL